MRVVSPESNHKITFFCWKHTIPVSLILYIYIIFLTTTRFANCLNETRITHTHTHFSMIISFRTLAWSLTVRGLNKLAVSDVSRCARSIAVRRGDNNYWDHTSHREYNTDRSQVAAGDCDARWGLALIRTQQQVWYIRHYLHPEPQSSEMAYLCHNV